tara:strand:+ start:11 stop:439 length:429 start_codon:yes stop_codon:yes gene_type:complete
VKGAVAPAPNGVGTDFAEITGRLEKGYTQCTVENRMEEVGVHEGGRGYKIDEKDPGESAVQGAIEGGGIGPAAHRRRAHEKHDPNVFCIFSYILRRCMKNKRHRGETNQGRSRDEQGGGVEVGCGDGMNGIVDIVGIFGMVC